MKKQKDHEIRTSIWPTFNLPYITVEEEYRLVNTVDIIASTGGSLGLFLGPSRDDMIWRAFEWLEAASVHNGNKARR